MHKLYYKPIPYEIERDALSLVIKFLKTFLYLWILVSNICKEDIKGKRKRRLFSTKIKYGFIL